MASIEVAGIAKQFPGRGAPALRDVSVSIADGELLVLLGPSGCGKSTLLRIIAGLEESDAGSIAIGAEDVTTREPKDRDIALVFQQYALYPHLTVTENIAYPLKVTKLGGNERRARVDWALELVGVGELRDRLPSQLSGGEQQRVALARAIVRRPRAFLMDEPLSNLDAQTRLRLRVELKALQRELGVTTVLVTHDQADAMAIADRIALLHEGRVQQIGTPDEIYDRPANRFVASFMGNPAMNLLDARVSDGHVMIGSAPLFEVRRPDGPIQAGIRPEDLHIVPQPDQSCLRANVVSVEPLGSETIVSVTAAGQRVSVRTAPRVRPAVGTELHLRPDNARVHLFDAASGEAIAPS